MNHTVDIKALEDLNLLGRSTKKSKDQAGKIVNELYRSTQPFIERLATTWQENIHFYEGDQWIKYDDRNRRYRTLEYNRFNEFMPRPTVNVILPGVQTITSLLTRSKPTADNFPNSSSERDESASKLVSYLQDAKWEIDEEQLKHVQAAIIMLLCGTVYRKDYWDNSLGKYSEEIGRNIGDNRVEMLSPFEVIEDTENDQWKMEFRVQSLNWIKQNFSRKGKGYTGMADEVEGHGKLNLMLSLRERLRTSSHSESSSPGGEDSVSENSAVVQEFYLKPSLKYKNGLLIICANEVPLYIGENPYWNEKYPDSWNPYTKCMWVQSPLRSHGISLVENIVPLQRRLNGLHALIMLNRMTMVSPQWLIPNGCIGAEGYIDGRPGLNIHFNGDEFPQKVPGVGLPGDVFKELEDVIQQIHNILGDNEVLQGSQPSGVNTAAALNMLLEQSYSKFSPQIQQWEKFIEKGQQKKLVLLQKFYKEERPDVVRQIKAINKDILKVDVDNFIGADLQDNINIRIEAGSSLPRSKTVEQQRILELTQLGLMGDVSPMSNPVGNKELLGKFGLKPIKGLNNAHVEKGKWTVNVLEKIQNEEYGIDEYPMTYDWDDINIHLQILQDHMARPEYEPKPMFPDQENPEELLDPFEMKFRELIRRLEEINSGSQQGLPPQADGGLPPSVPQDPGNLEGGQSAEAALLQQQAPMPGEVPIQQAGIPPEMA